MPAATSDPYVRYRVERRDVHNAVHAPVTGSTPAPGPIGAEGGDPSISANPAAGPGSVKCGLD